MTARKRKTTSEPTGTVIARAVALLRAGRPDTARLLLEPLARRKPVEAAVTRLLAGIDLSDGRVVPAAVGFARALAASREPALSLDCARHLSLLLAQYDLSGAVEQLERRALLKCLEATGIDHQPVAMAALRLVKQTPPWARFVKLAGEKGPEAAADLLSGDQGRAALADPLMLACLRRAVCCDATIEKILTACRKRFLEKGWPQRATGFVAALAEQNLLNEYVHAITDEEEEEIARRRSELHVEATAEKDLLTLSLYIPLHAIEGVERLEPASLPDLAPLLADTRTRLTEIELAESIPALGALDDSSIPVRAQYEEHPYPRWRSVGLGEDGAARSRLAELCGGNWRKPLDVLIAGCGTGRQAAMAARAYGADSRVLAIDLSRRSLAYAQRQIGELGLDNLTFRQGDILGLDDLDQTFDVIECIGVLHHMADPLAGWRMLVDRLRPGGVMSIGLYRTLGRQHVVEARARIAELGIGLDDDAIRSYRHRVIDNQGDPLHRTLAELRDFHSMSGCRDLLFHVRERNYELPEIERNLAVLGLDFLAFQAPQLVLRHFREKFGAAADPRDLGQWNRFERDHPDLFDAMYRFWCHKPA